MHLGKGRVPVKKFVVTVERVVTYRVNVEAEDAEEAEKKLLIRGEVDTFDPIHWDFATIHRPDRIVDTIEVPCFPLKVKHTCHLAVSGWTNLPEGGFAVPAAGIEDDARKLFGPGAVSGDLVVVRGAEGDAFMALYRSAASSSR